MVDLPSLLKKRLRRRSGREKSPPVERGALAAATVPDGGTAPLDETLTSALGVEVELVATALELTTAAVLLAPPGDERLHLVAIHTSRHDIARGPFALGQGICGAMNRGQEEVAITEISPTYNGIPYYPNPGGAGSLMALRLPLAACHEGGASLAILIADRKKTGPWQDREKHLLRLAARKLAHDIDTQRLCRSLDRERSAVRTLCEALRSLNRGLGLDSVCNATCNAVGDFVPFDFFALSLTEDEKHRTVFARGEEAELFQNIDYDIEDGLVGQVIKLRRPLPVNGRYNGPAPVFSASHALRGCRSLFVIPLCREEGPTLWAMTVAAREEGRFGEEERNILRLIAEQVAIKIDLAQAHEKISRLATTDGLTGLPNHRTFQHAFGVMLHRARRRRSPVSLILCDIDFFKSINDTYGHPFGDQVLQGVARVLAEAVRKEDLAARYGGEEFAIILENSDKHGARQMADRIRADIAALSPRYGSDEVNVTISLGIAGYPVDGEDKATLIEKADQALYTAKDQGRNRTVVYE